MNSVPNVTAPPPSAALLGVDHLLRIKSDQLAFYHDMRASHGDVVPLRLGPYRSWLLFHPDHIEELLTRQWSSFIRFKKLTDVVRQWNGDSLLLAEGQDWRDRRRKVLPAFQTRRLPAYGDKAVIQSRRMCAALAVDAGPDGQISFDTDTTMAKLTLDIATATFFGAQPRENADEIEEAIQVLSTTAFRESTSPFSLPDWLPLKAKRQKKWAMKVLDDLVMGLVRERLAQEEVTDQNDLLSSLVAQHDGNLLDIRNDTMSLLIAGHETSGALLGWLFACLARHADWLEQAQSEVDGVLHGRAVTADDLMRMPVIRAIVNETLRLYPPAYTLFLREATADVDLLGCHIRKGDLVQIIPFLTQRDPRFFTHPVRFDPSRFLNGPTWPQYAYLPFGAGPRVCIGQNFGLMEVCLVVATVLQNMTPAPTDSIPEPLAQFSLRPKGGAPMDWRVR